MAQITRYSVVWRVCGWNQLKIVPEIGLSPNSGACAGGNSENGAGNIFTAHYKECSLEWQMLTYLSSVSFVVSLWFFLLLALFRFEQNTRVAKRFLGFSIAYEYEKL